MNRARLGLWIAAAMVFGSANCASSTYRIPGAEMQRLAELNVAERGNLVRVMPVDASTAYLGPAPTEPALSDPAPAPDQADDGSDHDQPLALRLDDPAIQSDSAVDVAAPARRAPEHRALPAVRNTGTPASGRSGGGSSLPVVTPVLRGAPISGGGAPFPRGGGFAGRASTAGSARIPAPRIPTGGGHSGGGHSGGFSGGDAIVALVAVIIIVGLVAVIAEAASETPPPFDGWAQIPAEHPVHLHYQSGAERTIKLGDLQPIDLVGLRDTIVKDSEGALVRLPADADRRLASSRRPAREPTSLSAGP